MRTKYLLMAALAGLTACSKQVVPSGPYPTVVQGGLGEAAVMFDYPTVYRSQISEDVSVEFSAHCALYCDGFWGDNRRVFMGVLAQTDGKSVAFDPDDPADKILQIRLLPAVAEAYKQAQAMDAAYMKHPEAAFIDGQGRKWVRQ